MANITPVPDPDAATPIALADPPADLEPAFARFFISLVSEVKTVRQHATRADIEMCATAARAAQGEENARALAQQHFVLGDSGAYRDMTKLAQSESRSKQAALSSLQLVGDRRGASQMRRNLAALTEADAGGDAWSDLL